MKTFLKLSLVILSITLVNCKKDHDEYYEVELKNEPAIVRLMTDLPDGFENNEWFYLELVNPHPELTYTALNTANMAEGHEGYYFTVELLEQYKTEGLSVLISGIILDKDPNLTSVYGWVKINDIYFHDIVLTSILGFVIQNSTLEK